MSTRVPRDARLPLGSPSRPPSLFLSNNHEPSCVGPRPYKGQGRSPRSCRGPHKRPAWPTALQLGLGLAAPAFLTGAEQGFGERTAAGLLLRLALRGRCHRRAEIVARHALRRTFDLRALRLSKAWLVHSSDCRGRLGALAIAADTTILCAGRGHKQNSSRP